MEPLMILLKPFLYALPVIIAVWFLERKYNQKQKEKYRREFEAEQATNKNPVKISNSEADFQRWKAENHK